MERKQIVHNAYAVVGQLSKGYDGMMKNESLLGRLANRFFWQLSGSRYESFVRQAFQGIPKGFSGTLLEVPVGTGVLSLPHYHRMKSAKIVCLDYSEQMLQQAMTSPAARGLHQVKFVRGDVGNLQYLDGSFDCVLSLNGLHAFPNKMAAFHETYRVLKKGGTFTGCCYVKGQNRITDLFVQAFCVPMGFFTPPFDTAASLEETGRIEIVALDKTGTITEPGMNVQEAHAFECAKNDQFDDEALQDLLADYCLAAQDTNETMQALRAFSEQRRLEHPQEAKIALDVQPFSSRKKYSAITFETGTYLFGAPEFVLKGAYAQVAGELKPFLDAGCRVLLLGMYDGALTDETLSAGFLPIALILLSNKIRAEAPETFGYFAAQGVAVKVISGDNARTVSEVAKRAGIENADRFVDARTLTTEEAIRDAAGKYTVFGRVTPAQKRSLVQALKADGHTVAMTGDGVNDVLALKEADCSIAMASGSDVACQVSHIVLLDSNFASMPSVVAEGRRVINNIERSASLYLVKNIFSFFLAFFTLFATLPYPFSPAQLTLVSAVTIGIPSFILAMEPNESLVKGKFLRNVLFRALPAAMTDLAMVVGILLFYIAFQLDDTAMITICTGVMGIVGLMMVHRTCQPYNTIRKVMIVVLGVLFVIAYFGFPTLFNLQELNLQSALILIVFGLLSWPVMKAFCRLNDHMRTRFEAWRAGKTAKAA